MKEPLEAQEAPEIVRAPGQMTLSERAGHLFKDEEEEQQKQVEEALENPLSQYYANKHPEIVKTA